MKKLILLLSSVFIFSSCTNETSKENTSSVDLKTQIESIAKQYGYTLDNLSANSDIYKVSDVKELKNKLQLEKEFMATPKYQGIGIPITKKNIFNFENSIEQQLNLLNNINRRVLNKDGDPVYTHSSTVYFDNPFPQPNVSVTIWYNTDSSGNITAANVTTNTWGYGIGTYTQQSNINIYTNGGTIVFQVTGQFSNSIGLGSYSLGSNNIVQFVGNLSTGGGIGSGGGSSGGCNGSECGPSGMVKEIYQDQLVPADH